MKTFASIAPLVLLALTFTGCNRSPQESVPSPVTESNGHIRVDPNSPFFLRLKPVAITQLSQEKTALRTVGQMIALANPSGGLEGSSVSWVELSPEVTRAAGLHLPETELGVGYAFGVTLVAEGYSEQIRPGQRVEVARYGLRQSSTAGTVYSIHPSKDEPGSFQVVFLLKNGQNWYPGTNCEIDFPLIQSQAYRIPPTALLHEGLQEYVLKEVALGEYAPKTVTVSNETSDSVDVLGALHPGDRIVADGAILLKPLLHSLREGPSDDR